MKVRKDKFLDPSSVYLKDVNRSQRIVDGEVCYLTLEEEKELAHNIKAGIQARKRKEQFNGSLQEVASKEVDKVIKQASLAKDKLAGTHLFLVMDIAKQYQGLGVEFEDLIQDGNLGLTRALDKYDSSLNVTFFIYAKYWIKEGIIEGFRYRKDFIRIPEYMQTRINKLETVEKELESKLKRTPTNEEIAKEIGISLEQLDKALEVKELLNGTTFKLYQEGDCENKIDGKSNSLEDLATSPNWLEPENNAIENEKTTCLAQALETLGKEEVDILLARIVKGESLKSIGKRIGLSEYKVKNIIKETIRELHNMKDLKGLFDTSINLNRTSRGERWWRTSSSHRRIHLLAYGGSSSG